MLQVCQSLPGLFDVLQLLPGEQWGPIAKCQKRPSHHHMGQWVHLPGLYAEFVFEGIIVVGHKTSNHCGAVSRIALGWPQQLQPRPQHLVEVLSPTVACTVRIMLYIMEA